MSHSYIQAVLHTTFSTKYRRPLITPAVEVDLHHFLADRLQHMRCKVYEIGGTLDHVHLLHGLPRQHSIAEVMQEVKSRSSCWMKSQGIRDFQWQVGYGCHSADYRRLESIRRYIRNQKLHHYGSLENYRRRAAITTFEQEYRCLLDRFDLAYREEYLFPTPPSPGADAA